MSTVGLKELFLQIQSYCKTDSGKQSLKNFVPYSSPSQATKQCRRVMEFKHLIMSEAFNFQLNGLDLAQNWLRKVKKNQTLQTLDLNDIRLFLEDVNDLKNLINQNKFVKSLSDINHRLFDPKDILSYINVVVSPAGEINSDASEELYKFFQDKKNLNSQVQNLLKKIVKDQDLENVLQDRFVTTREGRMVLPVISGMRHDFQGIIHDSSNSKQTVFMEPQEVVPVNNKIAELEVRIKAEIEKILREISHFIFLKYDDLEKSFETLIEIDTLYAMGFFSATADLSPFSWSENNEIYLPDLKHPLLKIEIKDVIANSVELNEKNRILILSGPNAGGKTVLLKSIGLACLMATYGLPICSLDSARIPFIKKVFISLGDEQNLEENLSSFGGHLVKLNEASQLKGFECLLLIDEICGTTEAQEGAALARSFIEEFKSNKVFAVITSHLAPLRSHWNEGVINGSMQYDSITQAPSYTFVMGLAGESMALPTAKRYGVSEVILSRALNYLTPEAQKKYSGLEEIENLKSRLVELQSQYQFKLKELEKREQHLLKERKEVEELKNSKLEEDITEHQKRLEELIKYEKIKSTFDNSKNLKAIKEQMPKIIKYTGDSTTEITTANFETKFPPGTAVFLKSLNRKGIVQGKLNSKGEVPVLSESMRLQIHYTEILPATGTTPNKKIIPVSAANITASDLTQKTVDLRGMQVDEALDQMDLELDQAVQRGLLKLKIIHGHGDQDKLKKAIRTFLSRNTFIKSWLSGKAFNESDGVTVAEVLS